MVENFRRNRTPRISLYCASFTYSVDVAGWKGHGSWFITRFTDPLQHECRFPCMTLSQKGIYLYSLSSIAIMRIIDHSDNEAREFYGFIQARNTAEITFGWRLCLITWR
jgi:hypothetical protein